MAGITALKSTPVGNQGENLVHFAVSTQNKATTAAADSTLLFANGGPYREGDVVIASCTDGALVGRVSAAGAIVA
jgi:hypothetical protein